VPAGVCRPLAIEHDDAAAVASSRTSTATRVAVLRIKFGPILLVLFRPRNLSRGSRTDGREKSPHKTVTHCFPPLCVSERPVRKLVHEMSSTNPLWGAPRIHGELLKLGHRDQPG
jgi:hypothetical protein